MADGAAVIEASELIHSNPSVEDVLRILNAAGEEGILASDIARRFTRPDVLQRRNTWVNQILTRLWSQDRAKRSEQWEPSPHYHNTPSYRWFPTSDGELWLARGCWREDVKRNAAFANARQKALRERAEAREAALTAAAALVSGLRPRCSADRAKLIHHLRSQNLTLREIGSLFNVTRERIRQIINGQEKPCSCPACHVEGTQSQ